jgi:hypothetical protein
MYSKGQKHVSDELLNSLKNMAKFKRNNDSKKLE